MNVDDLHRNLIVAYLPQGWSTGDLRDLFSAYGEIEDVKVVRDKRTHMSKGFGFVKFHHRADAERAMSELQGYAAEGKHLHIEKAEFGKGPRGPASVYVAGFDRSVKNDEEIKQMFDTFGTIVGVKSILPRPQRQGVLFIDYDSFAEAELAVKHMNGYVLEEGGTLTVRLGKKSASAAAHHAAQRAIGAATVTSVSTAPSALMAPYSPCPFISYVNPQCQSPYSASPPPSMRSYPLQADYSPTCVFIYGVSDEEQLRQIVEEIMPVHRVQVPPGKRYGFVHTLSPIQADMLVEKLDGRRVRGLPAPLQARWKAQPH